jgi:alkylhydroperoxidase family enzyme
LSQPSESRSPRKRPIIPYVDPPQEGQLNRTFDAIVTLRGRLLNIHRLLANNPPALSAFMGMSEYVRDRSSLPVDLRELAILTTSVALDVEYEWFHHAPLARQAGVRGDQLEAIRSGAGTNSFSRVQQAVIQYAREASRIELISDLVAAEVTELLTKPEVIDLALTVGWYHLCATILVPMGVDLEANPG